jgi:undecaprenyl diphosphate synthase
VTLLTRLRTARTLLGLGSRPQPAPPPRPETPTSVAIIMDGNGRWARSRGLPVAAGHRAGARALKRVVRAAGDAGVRDLTVFSFSTENWNRPPNEVEDLMGLFCELIDREVPELHAERVRIRFIGRLEDLDDELLGKIAGAEALRFADCGPDAGEAEFAACLYGPDLRDPELIIRTSGEQRLSNFLLWQGAYSELVFSPRLWPDFGPEDLDAALREYAGRQRRFGAR